MVSIDYGLAVIKSLADSGACDSVGCILIDEWAGSQMVITYLNNTTDVFAKRQLIFEWQMDIAR